jgi:hypothetical protein
MTLHPLGTRFQTIKPAPPCGTVLLRSWRCTAVDGGASEQFRQSRKSYRSAVSRHAISFGMATGLAKKSVAPAFIAPARTLSSGNAVMKMKGAA